MRLDDDYLTTEDAARELGVDRDTIIQAIHRHARGRPGLPALAIGGIYLIRRADLAAYAERRRPWYPPRRRVAVS